MPSNSAASADVYPTRTAHGHELPANSVRNPIPSIWRGCAPSRANARSAIRTEYSGRQRNRTRIDERHFSERSRDYLRSCREVEWLSHGFWWWW
jgi:hypothetical protein